MCHGLQPGGVAAAQQSFLATGKVVARCITKSDAAGAGNLLTYENQVVVRWGEVSKCYNRWPSNHWQCQLRACTQAFNMQQKKGTNLLCT